MTLGLVVPVKDRLTNLHVLVSSLTHQTNSDFVLAVVDGGSTDGTCEFLAELAADDFWSSRLLLGSVEPGETPRIARARNLGAALLPEQVETMVILDSDIILQPDALASIAEIAGSHPDAVAFGPVHWLPQVDTDELLAFVRDDDIEGLRDAYLLVDPEIAVPMPDADQGTLVGPEIRFSLFGGIGPVDPDEARPMRPYWLVAPNSVWSLDTFRRLGGFDESLVGYGDSEFDLGVRMEKAGVYVLGRPELWALHQWHPKTPQPAGTASERVNAQVREFGMPAEVFMMVRRGEWNASNALAS